MVTSVTRSVIDKLFMGDENSLLVFRDHWVVTLDNQAELASVYPIILGWNSEHPACIAWAAIVPVLLRRTFKKIIKLLSATLH